VHGKHLLTSHQTTSTMCGILGLIHTPWHAQAASALAALASRGPDNRNILNLGGVILGHTRLSVIDIAGGHQPMSTQDERFTIVFNGEIYNFQTLRAELERLGHKFSTHSDTEVLLNGHIAWGDSLVKKLDGMFAYAIWDAKTQTLSAARDRMGIKPFFYSDHQGLSFASTLAAFRQIKGFPCEFDWEAVRDYLAYQTCLAPHSFYKHVKQLPPAHQLNWSEQNGVKITQYWKIPNPTDQQLTHTELIEQVDCAINSSIRAQRIADVPLGAFLSGGIDSSLAVRYLVENGAQHLQTFSMRFQQKAFDETKYAKSVAQHFGCEHHVIDAPNITAERFTTAIADLDQPLADSAYVMTHALSEFTRNHVTVAVSGDGGDELFAGYPRYGVQQSDFPRMLGQSTLRNAVMRGILPGKLLRRALWGEERMLYRQVEAGPWPTSRKSLKELFSANIFPHCHAEDTLGQWRRLALSFSGEMDTASLMRADLWTYLSENCLVKTDRASMAHGLEVRVPLIGNAVIDSVLSQPSSQHFDEDGGKLILRMLAKRHLPECVWNRPKHGFSVPLRDLFKGPWQELGDDLFSRSNDIAPFINATTAQALWKKSRTGHGQIRLTYSLLVLLLWLDLHGPSS